MTKKEPTQKEIDEQRAISARMNEYGAGLLQRLGYKEPKQPSRVTETLDFFIIEYHKGVYLDDGQYQAVYAQIWSTDSEGNPDDLIDMEMVYGATVMEVISELMTVLGRPIKADEWELGYDERYAEGDNEDF